MFTRITSTTTIDVDVETFEKFVSVDVSTVDVLPEDFVQHALIGACLTTLNQLGYVLGPEDLAHFRASNQRPTRT